MSERMSARTYVHTYVRTAPDSERKERTFMSSPKDKSLKKRKEKKAKE